MQVSLSEEFLFKALSRSSLDIYLYMQITVLLNDRLAYIE